MARFAARRLRVADGPAQQIRDKPAQHLPGEEAWVVGERRASGEAKYYLSNLPADSGLATLAATITAVCTSVGKVFAVPEPALGVVRRDGAER